MVAISRALGDRRNMAYTQAFLGAYLTLDQDEQAEAQRKKKKKAPPAEQQDRGAA